MGNKELEEHLQIVTSAQISKILGFTTARIRQLENDGSLVKVSHGKFDLAASIQKYIETIKEKEVTEQELDLNKEKTLLTRAQREKVELELKIMKGMLHRAEDVKRVMNSMLGAFRARCLSIPSKSGPSLIGLTDLIVIQDTIRKDLYEALDELKDYDPHTFYAESDDTLVLDDEADLEEEAVIEEVPKKAVKEKPKRNGRKKKSK